jgi:tetratricopeptide (TPR) repeat protein
MKNLLPLILSLTSVQVIAQATDSSVFYYNKGVDEKAAKRWLVASAAFDKAIKLNPKYTAAYLENGYVNLEMRRTDNAKNNFEKVYGLDPNNAAAGKELMDLYFGYHQYQQAIDFAQKCTACPNAQKMIALSYFKLEDYNNAEKLLLKLVKQNPTDAELVYTLGRTYLEMELEAKAIPYYTKAIQLDDSHGAWSQELGLLYYNNQKFKDAVVCFNKAAEKGFTQSLDFKENLGYAYIYSGDFEKGETILLSIAEKKRGSKDILRDLAQAYYDQKMYDKALDFCQRLMEMDMKDAKALYQAGLCFQKKGQKERGQQMCDKAIELDPSLNALRQKKMEMF